MAVTCLFIAAALFLLGFFIPVPIGSYMWIIAVILIIVGLLLIPEDIKRARLHKAIKARAAQNGTGKP